MEKFFVNSAFDGLPLRVNVCAQDGERKAVVLFVHGMAEHIDRYAYAMEFLAKQGYAAAGYDHRGHGESVRCDADLGYFGDPSGQAVVDDVYAVVTALKERCGNLPVYLFGHSMGTLVVRCYLQKYGDTVEKVVLCGAPAENPLAEIAIVLAKSIAFFKGERHRSKTLSNLSVGGGDKKFPADGKNAWLSKNKDNRDRYNADPLCGYTFTCNGYENLFRLLANAYADEKFQRVNPALPIRFIAGADDPIIVSENAFIKAQESLRRVGYQNVSGKLYQGLRHELLNEDERENILQDVCDFFEKRV